MDDGSKYIEIRQISPVGLNGRKTPQWAVVNKRTQEECGRIKWWGGFRSYAFFPTDGFHFDTKCLRQIASFIDNQMLWRKTSKASSK